ncbi:MAG TPA: hypothetical protein VK539_07960 [Myxococcaceae bacterium]|nr:hypothetical protein [Myxococcaceae bacterium]
MSRDGLPVAGGWGCAVEPKGRVLAGTGGSTWNVSGASMDRPRMVGEAAP